MKGSQMEEDEGREEKEEKIWRLKPIAFQVNSMQLIQFDCPITLALIQDPDQETHVVKIWDCYGKDSQVWILIFLPICASLNPKITFKLLQEKEVQLEREGRVLKSLFFNSLPTDPAEPDLVDRGGDPRAVVKDIPGDDQVSC